MVRLMLPVLALLLASAAFADGDYTPRLVDLRDPLALEELRRTNPAHYDKIQRILAGLAEEPARAESDWLQVNFNARRIDLSRMLLKTSNPPKQLLRFTLGDVRYALHVTRPDLVATVSPARLKSPTER